MVVTFFARCSSVTAILYPVSMNETMTLPVIESETTAACIRHLNAQFSTSLHIQFRWYSERADGEFLLSKAAAELVRRFVLAARRRAALVSVLPVTFVERNGALTVVASYVLSPWAATAQKDFDFLDDLRVLDGAVTLKKSGWDEYACMTVPAPALL